jgi:glycosyltransferase involved in cell wall biosynthesis
VAPERARVLHVITRLVVGGAQENTLLTVAHLDRTRYEVTLASGPTAGPEGSLEARIPPDVRFVRIPHLVREPHLARDATALRRLWALVRRDRYHIVHTHTTKAGLLGRVAARLCGTAVVVHTPHGHAFHGYLGGTGSRALVWTERMLARWTDRIVCLTEAERTDHLRYRIAPPERFEVIPSGVDLARFEAARTQSTRALEEGEGTGAHHGPAATSAAARLSLGLPPEGPLVGCVARLVPVKGVRYLLEAVPAIRAAVPGARVVFVGDGPLREEMEQAARAQGLDGAAVFMGLRDDVPALLPRFDVAVLPSLNEGQGRAAVEALAAGVPVVASRVSGLQDVVQDGATGRLVAPGDAGALAQAVIGLLRDPALRRSMSARARASVAAYDVRVMIKRLDDLYRRLLAAVERRDI